jgi:ribonucleotide monophosphatase NagD (HAD superfamily)
VPTRRGSRSFAAKLSTLSAKVLKLSPPGKLRVESAGVRFGRQVKSLMVGDSLQVDIEPAARAGAITAYKPVRFLGMEEAKTRRGATHVVGSLLEALAILDSLLAAVD